jgi:hypothetical protein
MTEKFLRGALIQGCGRRGEDFPSSMMPLKANLSSPPDIENVSLLSSAYMPAKGFVL